MKKREIPNLNVQCSTKSQTINPKGLLGFLGLSLRIEWSLEFNHWGFLFSPLQADEGRGAVARAQFHDAHSLRRAPEARHLGKPRAYNNARF